jgi:hypothetical protein
MDAAERTFRFKIVTSHNLRTFSSLHLLNATARFNNISAQHESGTGFGN